jgi:hypothetical protein
VRSTARFEHPECPADDFIVEGVHLLRGWPANAINVYVAGDVLIDAATRQGEGRIMRQTIKYTVPYVILTGLMAWGSSDPT